MARLYNIEEDPGEKSPIEPSSEVYKKAVPRMLQELKAQQENEQRSDMRCQLQDFWRSNLCIWKNANPTGCYSQMIVINDKFINIIFHRVLPAPWLQPCCNPPFCRCDDSKEPGEQDSRWLKPSIRTISFLINCSKLMDTMMDVIKKTAGYKETGDDYTLEDFEEEELLDD